MRKGYRFTPEEIIAHREKRRATCMAKYGVSNPNMLDSVKTKFRNTCIEKYGVDNPLKCDSVKRKLESTSMRRYGTKNPFQNRDVIERQRLVMISKHGSPFPLQCRESLDKFRKTNTEKYGCECPLSNHDVAMKARATTMQRYGVAHAMRSDVVKDKVKRTNMKNLGVEWPQQSSDVRRRSISTKIEKYGYGYGLQDPHIRHKAAAIRSKNARAKWEPLQLDMMMLSEEGMSDTAVAHKLGVSVSKTARYLRSQGVPSGTISHPEQQVIDMLNDKFPGVPYSVHDRTVLVRNGKRPLEIDVFIPSLALGIEINGWYWHKDDAYMYKHAKWEMAKAKGIDLLSVDVMSDLSSAAMDVIEQLVRNSIVGIDQKCQDEP